MHIKSVKTPALSAKATNYFWLQWLDPRNPKLVTFGVGLKVGQSPVISWPLRPDFDIDTVQQMDIPGHISNIR